MSMLKKFASFVIVAGAIVLLFNVNMPKARAADTTNEYTNKKLGISFSVPAGYIVADADNHNALNVPMSNNDITQNTIMILDSNKKNYCIMHVEGAYCWNLDDLDENQKSAFIDQSPQKKFLYKRNLASLYANKNGFQFYVFKDTYVARCVTAKNGEIFDFEFYGNYENVNVMQSFIDTVSFVPFSKPYSDSVACYTSTQFKLNIPPQYVAIDKSNINNNELTLTKWYYTVDGISQNFSDKSTYKLFMHNYFYDYSIWVYQSYSEITDLNTATQDDLDRLKNRAVSFATSLKATVTSSDYVRNAQNKINYLEVKYFDKDATYVRYYFEKDNYEYEIICRDAEQTNHADFSVIANSFVPSTIKHNSTVTNGYNKMGIMFPTRGLYPIVFLIIAASIILAVIVLPIVLVLCLRPKQPPKAEPTYGPYCQTPPPYKQEPITSDNPNTPHYVSEHNDTSDAPPTDIDDFSSNDNHK